MQHNPMNVTQITAQELRDGTLDVCKVDAIREILSSLGLSLTEPIYLKISEPIQLLYFSPTGGCMPFYWPLDLTLGQVLQILAPSARL